MVFIDISKPETDELTAHKDVWDIASVSDRLMAMLIDLLIAIPVVSFFLSWMLKELKVASMLSSSGDELMVLWLVTIAAGTSLVVFVFGLCLYFRGATPGQEFLQLRTISFHSKWKSPQQVNSTTNILFGSDEARLGLAQSFIRVFLWCFSFLFFAIPFLEVLSHPLRRAFHERATDTMVITLKRKKDSGPHPLETRFIHSWVRTFAVIFLFLMAVSMIRIFQNAHHGVLALEDKSFPTCSDISSDVEGLKRLDAAIALHLTESVSADCVQQEARAQLWSHDSRGKSLAYLAMSLVVEDDRMSDNYRAKACTEKDQQMHSEVCAIVKFLDSEDKDKADILRRAGLSLMTSRVLLLENLTQDNQVLSAMAIIEDLRKEGLFDHYLDRQEVRNIWSLQDRLKNSGGRAPASVEEENLIEEFKKDFEIP